MPETLTNRVQLFVNNRDAVKSSFKWDYTNLHPLSAYLYTEKDLKVNVEKMEACKQLIKQATGIFSTFRGTTYLINATQLSLEENPEEKFRDVLTAYDYLKEEFSASHHLPLSAFLLASQVDVANYTQVVQVANDIYRQMKKEHPFLTSSEDISFAVLFAIHNPNLVVEDIIDRMETCYKQLKGNFFQANAVQALSHTLALGEEAAEIKTKRVLELYDRLKANKVKFGTGVELAVLGVLSLITEDIDVVTADIVKVNELLKKEKGFGAWGTGHSQRILYAALLVALDYTKNQDQELLNLSSVNSITSIVIAQQLAITAVIAASASASAASSSGD